MAPDPSEAVLAIVGAVLGIERPCTLDDDLLDLGASSLEVIQVLTLIEDELLVELAPDLLLAAPDLRAVVRLVEAAAREARA